MGRARAISVVVGLLAAAVGVVTTAPVAQAASTTMFLRTLSEPVTSSTGQSLSLNLDAQEFDDAGTQSAQVDVTLATVSESHRWTFPVTPASLSYDDSAGTGALVTRSQLGKFGTIRMTFTRQSEGTGCNDPRVVGSLAGRFRFDTRTTQWGSVGGDHMTFSPVELYLGPGPCMPVPLRCDTGIAWTGPDQAPQLAGEPEYGRNVIFFTRAGVALPDPLGATRTDDISAQAKKVWARDGVLHIVGSGTGFSGRATISGGAKSVSYQACGPSVTLKVVHHADATWTSSNTDPFTTRFQITPDYQPAPGPGATFDKISLA